ncbi:MAG: dTDP-4-dehydrorhamnose 3,5-epimerase family protein [Rhodospirillales bacterium]
MIDSTLPFGVQLTPLDVHRDGRGWLSEIYRRDRPVGVEPCQWNLTYSDRNVLRGVHVHLRHSDFFVVAQGRVSFGLYDLRRRTPTHGRSALIEMSSERLSGLTIPIGVMHGFYCHEPTMHIYGFDALYDVDDDLGCHWSDPALRIAWPCADPVVSDRNRTARSLAELQARLREIGADL